MIYQSVKYELVFLTQSSKASLIRETMSTIANGATFVYGLTGLQLKKFFRSRFEENGKKSQLLD